MISWVSDTVDGRGYLLCLPKEAGKRKGTTNRGGIAMEYEVYPYSLIANKVISFSVKLNKRTAYFNKFR
ncbi:hypothetical protein Back11_49090 [Paenibacillus baekrokdamisoli]|uniref:Uncharacterized protein n=1 Tax=Paenibacillus baekrokdamisoli TaxID=1712516 RepID=A0A3G9JKW5_9BACL|nr:hypothetical protein [Paenibacillus baekrokdamisoli]BBH23564.1 hypothetical protein Back11_49090 [Paenibacillus baekrokdamisoli]